VFASGVESCCQTGIKAHTAPHTVSLFPGEGSGAVLTCSHIPEKLLIQSQHDSPFRPLTTLECRKSVRNSHTPCD
jgi:hypothetical protein